VSRIEQSGRMSLRRPKPPIKGGSAPEEEEEEEEYNSSISPFTIIIVCNNILKFSKYWPDDGLVRPKLAANI